MVERIVISPPPGSRLGSPEVRPTGRLNLTDRQKQVIKGQEEERAGQAQLENLASRYNNRFNPELRAAITAQQELGRNSTAAADYVTQIGMERRKEEIQRGLLGADQPNGLAGKTVDIGSDLARDQNTIGSLSGLLGDINWKAITDRLIKTFQRPEMLTPGVNALTAFGMSGAALNQAEIAGAKEQAQLDQANQQQALENEYRRTRDARDAARLALDKEKARADTALAGTDKVTRDIINDLYNTAFGRFIGYETLGGGQGASKEDTQAAVAAEAISIQNANPRMSPVEAVREAAKRLQAKASAAPSKTKKDRFAPKN
jgi:hypothetical protein